jgi:hypothetical protein
MPTDLIAAVLGIIATGVGGLIAIVAGVGVIYLERQQRAKSIRTVAIAEVSSVLDKSQRYLDGHINSVELIVTSPMLISIASELGLLKPPQAVAYRNVVVRFSELKASENRERALDVIAACKVALNLL